MAAEEKVNLFKLICEVSAINRKNPNEALIRETGKALGFKTSTPKVKDLCDSAIAYAIELGELTEGDHMIK